jgi:8-oxo-dGTP diphosphatase
MTEFEERYGKIVKVVAALIWDDDKKKFLACRRPAHKTRGLLWEFVGGKVEKGETLPEALERECMEELAINIKVNDVFVELTHEYPDMTVRLTLFNCEIISGEPQLLEHSEIKWMTPAETVNYDFCPADDDILEELRKLK